MGHTVQNAFFMKHDIPYLFIWRKFCYLSDKKNRQNVLYWFPKSSSAIKPKVHFWICSNWFSSDYHNILIKISHVRLWVLVILFGVCVLKCHVGYCYFNCGLVLCLHWSSLSSIRETCLATPPPQKGCGSWFSAMLVHTL